MAKPYPSPALLSILAILAAASGSPAPLPFLCPSLDKRQIPSTTIPPSTTPSHTRHIPSKFVKGTDGLWRRAESYTLYGSTVPCTGTCMDPTQGASPRPTPTDDIRDSLPLGWDPMPKPSAGRIGLIVALSLVLALVICFFIIGCVFWRKSIIKRRRRDLEAESKKHQPARSVEEEAKDLVEKESKGKQKILARATAICKANIRHTARHRKGKWVATSKSSQVHQDSHLSNSSRSRSVSLPPSSPRLSTVSLPDNMPQPIIGPLLPGMSQSPDTVTPHHPISPPAYHHGDHPSPIFYSDIPHAVPLDTQPSSRSSSSRATSDSDSSGMTTPKPFHAAHVATDDKAQLARLVDLASRPPEVVSADTLNTHVSAPAWHDEVEEIPPDFITSNDHPPDITCGPSSLFPPPSSKESMATDLYEYSFSFEDMTALEAEPVPSAPPFQLDSALLLHDDQISPSAPPLVDDTELVGVYPGAPQWESTSCQLDLSEENSTGQDHDRITSAEVPLSGLPSVQLASRREIGVVDDITLPGYRP